MIVIRMKWRRIGAKRLETSLYFVIFGVHLFQSFDPHRVCLHNQKETVVHQLELAEEFCVIVDLVHDLSNVSFLESQKNVFQPKIK